MKTRKMKIRRRHFDAAHYLTAEYQVCQNLHGHTYHIRNLVIETTKVISFADIDSIINSYDHCLIVPQQHVCYWNPLKEVATREGAPFKLLIRAIKGKLARVEEISNEIAEDIMTLDGVKSVSFELYEGDTNGVVVKVVQ